MNNMTPNEDKFLTLLEQLDPDLFILKRALQETHITPSLLVEIILAVAKITNGSGMGKVEVHIVSNSVRNINSQERLDFHKKALA